MRRHFHFIFKSTAATDGAKKSSMHIFSYYDGIILGSWRDDWCQYGCEFDSIYCSDPTQRLGSTAV